ncbi:hypothetical protein LINPERPRIM_LOCUS18010 [Linum perenne]
MRLLLPSSSLNSSLDRKMSTSSSSATSGCISGLLTRIFCSPTASTASIDPTSDLELGYTPIVRDDVAPSPPGIVARLMGLEKPCGDSICRSRSMNSLEFGVDGMDEKKMKNQKHRRVKSTISLTENDDFVVLSFEELDDTSWDRGNRGNRGCGKTEEEAEIIDLMVSRILTEESSVRDRFSGDQISPPECPSRDSKRLNSKRRKKRRSVADEEATECCSSSSEDASPVSVLDSSRQFSIDHEVSTASEDSETEASGEMITTSSFETNGFRHRKSKKVFLNPLPSNQWEGIIRMAEADAVEGLNSHRMYGSKCKIEDFEMVGAELEWYILDELLDELVHL